MNGDKAGASDAGKPILPHVKVELTVLGDALPRFLHTGERQ
jgi:hypothetical protein